MKIYIATLPNGFFGSAGKSWRSLDVNKLSKLLNYDTEVVTINDLMDIDLKTTDFVVYTSSDEENIRLYLKDVMYFIDKKCRILPSYDMLLSHENKGFQELLRVNNDFGNLRGNYFFDIDDAVLPMPKVLKTISGAGSSGVFLIKNKKDISKIRDKYFKVSKRRKVIKLQRKFKLKSKEFSVYSYRHKGFNRLVEQEFIPGLTSDFKILIFGDRYYSLKRSIRKNDFRASGSGLFESVKPPKAVLNFAKVVFDKLNTPYASLDIAISDKGCHLIEFQGTNFGPTTLLKSINRCIDSQKGWIDEKSSNDLEENFSYAINRFIKNNKLTLS